MLTEAGFMERLQQVFDVRGTANIHRHLSTGQMMGLLLGTLLIPACVGLPWILWTIYSLMFSREVIVTIESDDDRYQISRQLYHAAQDNILAVVDVTSSRPETPKTKLTQPLSPLTLPRAVSVRTPSQTDHKQRKVVGLRRALTDFVVVDIETTGFEEMWDKIIQISALKVIGDKVVDRYNTYVNPHTFLSPEIEELTGITSTSLNYAPDINQVMPGFIKFSDSLPLVGHNIKKFDIPFLTVNGYNLPKIEVEDTWEMAMKARFPERPENLKLTTLKRYFGVLKTSHDALSDAETTLVVYQNLRDGKLERITAAKSEYRPIFKGKNFVVKGDFGRYSRKDITMLITFLAGAIKTSVSSTTDFLVLGEMPSRFLVDGTHSKSELKAIEQQNNGSVIQIIDYEHLRLLAKPAGV